MKTFRGVPAYRGYAIGPAFKIADWNDILALPAANMPVVLVARYLSERQVETLDLGRVYAIVVDRGSRIDPLWNVLAGIPKPSLVGCRGIWDAAREGAPLGVDAVAGAAAIEPDERAQRAIAARKGSAVPREDPNALAAIERLGKAIRTRLMYLGEHEPFDLPLESNERLIAIARKVARGEAPSTDDDAFIAGLMERPRAT